MAGCGVFATRWSDACTAELSVAAGEPRVVSLCVDPLVPVVVLGRYVGARRQAILAMKEHGRRNLVALPTRQCVSRLGSCTLPGRG
ncbi:hypothetical protein JK2ML_0776 [Mycobacterium leprae Kyoto-2]|uniref:ML0776 protein n=3 Tax=Mycobacterium leprae TaxID=1769 RepID=Q9CCI9_MYCLE|nr:hypothetical protein DIJ64_04230 [Mycobacterium leprae]OAR21822.1 hypothetical protein A8144_00895 [Mycobacterium leprae 3125609]OAX72365.1 hypothetical protein A3216_00970 [Mycobacterium leprae 7935681]CAR70870.1 unnamed protein product [Mycobacterium leprae Br4923]BBC16763.1 hypothetical protein JK2ML_0776 [Mycobacterium leprae Kyoto-2]